MKAQNSHGSSPLAWLVVVIITVAFAIGTLAIVLANWPMFWVGVGIVVVGGLVALIGSRAGAAKH